MQNVVLGELIKRRGFGYGYELRDQTSEIAETLGYSPTFVYAALESLEKQGYVEIVDRGEAAAGGGRQANSRVYYLVTDAGHDHFRTWKTTVPKKTPLREEIHMQLLASDGDDVPHMITALSGFEDQCRDQLRQLMERPLGSRASRGQSPGTTLVQDGILSHLQTTMEWAQRSRRALVTLMEQRTGVAGRRRP